MHWWKAPGDYTLNGITYHAISKLHPLYTGDRRSIKQGLLFGVATLKLLRADFDILEVDHMPFFPVYAAKLVSLVRRRPLFATWHEVWGKEYWQEYLGGLPGRIAYYIERLSICLPDHIVSVSEHTGERVRDILHYNGKLTTISNGIDYRVISPIKPSSVHTDVIFTGRLLPNKNVNLLIDAIGMLKKTHPDISCYIVGGGPELPKLKAQVKRLHLNHNVTLTDYVELSEDVFSLMKSSRVFVLPSTREGFGITVLEAYACGLSTVTVNHPDNAAQYIAPKNRSIICDPTAEAIARAIEKSLSSKANPPVQDSQIEQYDWKQLAAKQRKVYVS